MTLIYEPGTYSAILHWMSPNFIKGEAITTFGVRPLSGQTIQQVADSVGTAAEVHMLPRMDNEITFVNCEVFDRSQGATSGGGLNGGGDFEGVPPNTACLMKRLTGLRGRRAYGRAFWPGLLARGDVDDAGLIGPAQVSAIQADVDAFTQAVTDDDILFLVLQNQEGITPPLSPAPSYTEMQVQTRVATQRRRLR